jgi:mono/diheme cytochrome c family protein
MTRLAAALAAALLLAACDQNMADQPKYEAYEAGELFEEFQVMRPPVPGTVARGDLQYIAALQTRPPMSMDLLTRGRGQYAAFCSPCHGLSGNGHGTVVQRGMPAPPSFHIERLRQAPAGHYMRVIAEGYGVMYSYAARVPPEDRWAIVAYIRALQLAGHAPADELPEPVRRALLSEVAR